VFKMCFIELDSILFYSVRFESWHDLFCFFEMQMKTKLNNELKWFEIHCDLESIFHSLNKDNQLNELGISIEIKRYNIEKDLHLLPSWIVFNW
jgi:hypothetical protein